MNRKVIFVLTLAILLNFGFAAELICLGAEASDTLPVHNVNTALDYATIQAAVDAAETVNGHTVLVDAGIYSEHLVLSKSLRLLGNGSSTTTIDGGGTAAVVTVVADAVFIKGFSISNGLLGIFLDHSYNSSLLENNVTGIRDFYAVYASHSDYCRIEKNLVGPNLGAGILVTNSLNFEVSGNYVHGNEGYGLNANASMGGLIRQNDVSNNSYDGIGLGEGCQNCTIAMNNVSDNQLYGLWLDSDSTGNLIYGNSIVRNSKQASVYLANRWDNGFEGNFWSDYSGVDADHNGIADVPLTIADNNTDNKPLMGPMHVFSTPLGFDVDVISNSSIVAFDYFDTNGTLRMGISDPAKPGDYGFCRMRIPHALMTEPFNAFVDGANPLYWNYTLRDDGDSQWIYFAYQRSPHMVLIEGTPRSRGQDLFWYLIAAAMTVFAVVVAVIVVYYRKLRKKSSQAPKRV
jgi:nitrous oxidase accessory protein